MLPVERIADLNDDEYRKSHCLWFWMVKDFAVQTGEHPWFCRALHMMGLQATQD